jgi:3-mercaptopyruvate sulfurtransferase SseA
MSTDQETGLTGTVSRRSRRYWLAASLSAAHAACGVRVVNPNEHATPVAITPPASDEAVTRVDVKTAHARWLAGSAVFVDTRGVEAFTAGHIKGAMALPLAEVDGDPARARRKLPAGKLAVFYCT